MRGRIPLAACLLLALAPAAEPPPPAWATAAERPPMTAAETKAFMRKLAEYVFENHLKRSERSEQRGMVYEYFDVARKGRPDQWVQGEALDTMHDGAWLAAALATAYRATGDPFYKEFLTRWLLPFYVKMLHHSDTLFSAKTNDADAKAHAFNKEHAFIEGEKGFVPYWWDDGASVSLERRRTKNLRGPFPCTDRLVSKGNPTFALDGYSHGCSNHMAQDLAVMLETAWLLLKGGDDADRKLAADVALTARYLHESRMRHHGVIPAVAAAAALANADDDLMKRVPSATDAKLDNHYTQILTNFDPKRRLSFPGFADNQEYLYYVGLAKHGALPPPLALRLVYDAYTEPLLIRYWSDNAAVPPGINKFDLAPIYAVGGKPQSYRSDRLVGIGSRLGPQNLKVCGWALQALAAYPGLWEERYRKQFEKDVRVGFRDEGAAAAIAGRPDPADASFELGGHSFELTSTRGALGVRGTGKTAAAVKVKIFARSDGQGPFAMVTAVRGGDVTAVNDAGEALRLTGRATEIKNGWLFDFELPYTVTKGQNTWGNAVEHGRMSIEVNGQRKKLYFLSREEQVQRRLRRELAGGLRTWEAIFAEKGYIPTGIGAGGEWDRFSDSGGYAHLIAAAAEYLLVLEGKRDWEMWMPNRR